jgi:hypothetical protein
MLSQILRSDVEAYAATLLAESPLLEQARTGRLSPDALGFYLNGLRYITSESVKLLHFAAECAQSSDQPQLTAHYRSKADEEVGHDRWAEADIGRLERHYKLELPREQSTALASLTEFLATEIKAQPRCFMAYLFLVEHVTVLTGPIWMEALERHCGVPRTHLSVVKNHVDLDVEHVEEELNEIDTLASSEDLVGMRDLIDRSRGHIDAFFHEVASRAAAA